MIPLRAQLEEVNRELAMRARVYPRWIERGNLTPQKAARSVACLEATRDLLRDLIAKEESLPLGR